MENLINICTHVCQCELNWMASLIFAGCMVSNEINAQSFFPLISLVSLNKGYL